MPKIQTLKEFETTNEPIDVLVLEADERIQEDLRKGITQACVCHSGPCATCVCNKYISVKDDNYKTKPKYEPAKEV